MATTEDILNYVLNSPENTNGAVLNSMLEGLYDEPKEEAIAEINEAGAI